MPVTKAFILKGLLGTAVVGGVATTAVIYENEIGNLMVFTSSKGAKMVGGGGKSRRKREVGDGNNIYGLGIPDECILVGDEKRRECDISPEILKGIKFSNHREGEMVLEEGEGFEGMWMEVREEGGSMYYTFGGYDRHIRLSNGREDIYFPWGQQPEFMVDSEGRLKKNKSMSDLWNDFRNLFK